MRRALDRVLPNSAYPGWVAAGIGYMAGFLVDRMPERVALSLALLPLAGGLALLATVPVWGPSPIVYGALLAGPGDEFQRVLLPFAGLAVTAAVAVLFLGPPRQL